MRSRGKLMGAMIGLTAVGLVLLVAPTLTSGASRAGKAATQPTAVSSSASQITIWARGSWCWFADPRAVYVAGQYDETFVGWIDWTGGINVGAYDPHFGVRHSVVIGRLARDDHGSPSIFVEPDKRLTVFFSGHNGQHMYYRTTLRPEDITSWGPIQEVQSSLPGKKGFTYPNPLLLPAEGNRLYLFWRGSHWGIDYATRTIDGRWSPARHLVAAPGERPYLKAESNGSDTIGLAFTNGHPRERVTSIYYAAYRSGSLWHADGKRIVTLGEAPIAPERADVVYDGKARHASSWVWDTAWGNDGRPVIVYATFANKHDHAYWYAHFNGVRWVSHFMTFAGPSISPHTIEKQYSGGLALDHSNPEVVYLSSKVRGSYEIERWTTTDYGVHWQAVTVVRTPGSDNVRPVVTRGSTGGPMSILWLHGRYGSYTAYRTSIAYLR